jgi:hypothetical protein
MFKFDLARERGWSLAELDAKMDGNELAEWQAYHNLKPTYDFYWMTALICTTIANAMGSGKRYKISDFLPYKTKPKKKQTPEQALAAFDATFAHLITPKPTGE